MTQVNQTQEKTFAEKCKLLEKEYQALCKSFNTVPNERMVSNIQNAACNQTSTIKFNLGSPGMKDTEKIQDSEIIPLFEAIKISDCTDLITSIDLSWNRIGNIGAKSIASFITNNQYIQNINLKGNDISSDGGIEIATALIKTYSKSNNDTKIALQTLNFNGNKLGDNTMVKLSELFINKNTNNLTCLDIGNCDFGHIGWTHIMTRLIENKYIQDLNIENCRVNTLSHEMCSILSKVLCHNKSIKKLNISFQSDGISDDGMKWISNALKGNHILDTLDLSCNRIGCDGIKYLSEILSKSNENEFKNKTCSIKKLLLRGNRLTDIGARYICKMLETNQTLKYLDLRSTNLTNHGLFLIAQTVKQLKEQNRLVLKTLLLNDNLFGATAANKWLSVVENRQSKVLEFDFWPLIVQ